MANSQPTRSPKEIEADLAATRNRLSRTVDELAYRVSPETLKADAKAKVQGQINQLVGTAQGKVVDDEGAPRYDNITKILGTAAAVAITLGLLRRAFNRG